MTYSLKKLLLFVVALVTLSPLAAGNGISTAIAQNKTQKMAILAAIAFVVNKYRGSEKQSEFPLVPQSPVSGKPGKLSDYVKDNLLQSPQGPQSQS